MKPGDLVHLRGSDVTWVVVFCGPQRVVIRNATEVRTVARDALTVRPDDSEAMLAWLDHA